MSLLLTPEDVVRALGPLGPDYEGVALYTDGNAGLSVKRRYSAETELGRVTTRDGTPAIVCSLHVFVKSPRVPGGVSRVELTVSPHNPRGGGWIGRDPWKDPYLTPDAINRLRRAPIPLILDFNEEYVWDTAEGRFQNEAGETVTGRQILDYIYSYHCRTLSLRFRIKDRFRSAARKVVQQAVWRGQDWCFWLLEHGYEIRLKDTQRYRKLFHHYRFNEFERQTDKDGTHFFGFQSSKRAFFSNVIALALTCTGTYYLMPRFGLLRAIYANPALSTVALAFGFLMADQVVPLILEGLVCGLSRLRWKVAHLLSNVTV